MVKCANKMKLEIQSKRTLRCDTLNEENINLSIGPSKCDQSVIQPPPPTQISLPVQGLETTTFRSHMPCFTTLLGHHCPPTVGHVLSTSFHSVSVTLPLSSPRPGGGDQVPGGDPPAAGGGAEAGQAPVPPAERAQRHGSHGPAVPPQDQPAGRGLLWRLPAALEHEDAQERVSRSSHHEMTWITIVFYFCDLMHFQMEEGGTWFEYWSKVLGKWRVTAMPALRKNVLYDRRWKVASF